MGRLYGFHRLLQDESLDPHKLSSAIIDVCSAATAIVSFASKSFEPQTRPGSSNAAFPSPGQEFIASFSNEGPNVAFGTLFRTLARTFVNLLQGFGKLNKTTESRKYQGQLTYSFVKLFGDTLASLHTVSVIQTQSQARQDIRPPTDKGQAETTHQSDPKTTNNDTNLYIHLSQLLVTMIAALDLAKPHHINILEGFFYLLLQRVGKILYTFVFNEEESPILASRNAEQENLQTHGIEVTRNEASKTRAMHVEAKHLIWILERAMSFVHRQQVIPPPRKPPKSKIKNPSTTITPTLPNRHSAKPTLSEHAKTRLQNTLLKGVFGVDSEEFKNGLKMPTRAEMDLDMDLPTVAEEDVAEWFKGEVWRLVGWEILGEHVDM